MNFSVWDSASGISQVIIRLIREPTNLSITMDDIGGAHYSSPVADPVAAEFSYRSYRQSVTLDAGLKLLIGSLK